jgi:hypothetical protein
METPLSRAKGGTFCVETERKERTSLDDVAVKVRVVDVQGVKPSLAMSA